MIPKFYEFYPYILEILSDQKTYKRSEIRDILAKKMDITKEERQTLVPSKTQTVYDNRVNWACVYLAKAEVIKRPKRGEYTITSRGKNLIKEKGFNISKGDLERYESFGKYIGGLIINLKTNQKNLRMKQLLFQVRCLCLK